MAGKRDLCAILWFLFVSMDKAATNGKDIWKDLALPLEHLPYYFFSHGETKQMCLDDPSCPYKVTNFFISCFKLLKVSLVVCIYHR